MVHINLFIEYPGSIADEAIILMQNLARLTRSLFQTYQLSDPVIGAQRGQAFMNNAIARSMIRQKVRMPR